MTSGKIRFSFCLIMSKLCETSLG